MSRMRNDYGKFNFQFECNDSDLFNDVTWNVIRKLGWMDEVFAAKMNKFVFLVPLPVLLFEQLATVDFSEVWDIKFILFCFVVTAISITISTLISLLWKDRSIKGEFIRRLTGAVRRFLELLLSRIFTELREWHRL